MSPKRVRKNRKKATFGDPLSPAEVELLATFWSGFDTADVAKILGVSVVTVKKHLYHVRVKVGFRTWADLYRYGLEHGLIEAPPKKGG